jgi:hypothetical protein
MPERTFQQAFAQWQFGTFPGQKQEDQKFTPANLQKLGVDTWAIDADIDQQIQTQQSNSRTQEQFQESFNNAKASWKFWEMSDDEIFDWLLNSYKSKGFTIEGIDIDEELWTITTIEETPVFDIPGRETIWEKVIDVVRPSDVKIWALSTWFEVVWNLLWFWADLLTPKESEWLWDELKSIWLETKEAIQQEFTKNPEWLETKLWWTLAKYWLAFTPTPAWKAPLISKWMELIWNIPKVWNILKSAVTWAWQVAQFEAVTEWEVTKEWLTVWAVVNPFIWWIAKIVWAWSPVDMLRKITWLKPSQLKNLGAWNVKKDAEIVLDSIKATWDKPTTRLELFEVLNKRQQDIYTKNINPILAKAWDSWTVQLTWITDDILNKIDPKVAWQRTWAWIGQTKETEEAFEGLVNYWKNRETQKLTFQEIEDLKRVVATELREWAPKWLNKSFLTEINTRLWNQLEELLWKVWEWVKGFKREYAAISNIKEPLYAKVAQEIRDSWNDIVSQFWFFSALWQAARWEITAASKTALVVKIIEKMRDPNTLLNKMIKQIYWRWDIDIQNLLQKAWVIWTSQVWEELNWN